MRVETGVQGRQGGAQRVVALVVDPLAQMDDPPQFADRFVDVTRIYTHSPPLTLNGRLMS